MRTGRAAPPRTAPPTPHPAHRHRTGTSLPARRSSGVAATTPLPVPSVPFPPPSLPLPRHPTMSNLNKDTEHTNGSGNVEEEVGDRATVGLLE